MAMCSISNADSTRLFSTASGKVGIFTPSVDGVWRTRSLIQHIRTCVPMIQRSGSGTRSPAVSVMNLRTSCPMTFLSIGHASTSTVRDGPTNSVRNVENGSQSDTDALQRKNRCPLSLASHAEMLSLSIRISACDATVMHVLRICIYPRVISTVRRRRNRTDTAGNITHTIND